MLNLDHRITTDPILMTTDIQLTFESFDPNAEPLCNHRPHLNGFRRRCYYCYHAARQGPNLECTYYGIIIGARDKYALKGWKDLRKRILERDNQQCVICWSGDRLHIHHRNGEATDDDLDNLITLCDSCHARIHIESRKDGVQMRVERMLSTCLSMARESDRDSGSEIALTGQSSER
jgi:5-methylcytosine-specific restriction endonuclease McrA